MKEIIFLVQEESDGGWNAQAVGVDIITQADSTEELKVAIIDALQCHFEPNEVPNTVRLQFLREEVFSL